MMAYEMGSCWSLFFFFKVRAQANKLKNDLASKLKLKLSCPSSPRTPALHTGQQLSSQPPYHTPPGP
jgi:hypothetical protein